MTSVLKICLFGLISFLLFPNSLHAGETPWQEIAPDVRARLISSDNLGPDGTMLVGLQLDMPSSTQTYWRIPGETGIATQLFVKSTDGVSLTAIHWPYPVIDTSRGYLDYAYYGPTILPFSVALGSRSSATLDVDTVLGICLNICIPASANFSLALKSGRMDPGHALRLKQAMAEVPLSWNDSRQPFGSVYYDEDALALRVEVANPVVDPQSLIVETDDQRTLFGTPVAGSDGRTVSLPLLATDRAAPFVGGKVLLTFMTNAGPYELWRDAPALMTPSL